MAGSVVAAHGWLQMRRKVSWPPNRYLYGDPVAERKLVRGLSKRPGLRLGVRPVVAEGLDIASIEETSTCPTKNGE